MPQPQEIRQAVINAVRHVKQDPHAQLDDTTSFADFGLDSLDRMSVMVEVEGALGVDLEDTDPAKIENIAQYIARLQS